jgi:hypothetical protein
MKKFFLKCSVFVIVFLAANFLYLVICMKFDWNFSKRIEALNLKGATYKNIVLGNSLAMDGIDSRLLSSNPNNTYNLAIGGASLTTNYIQLCEYLEIAETKPKTVFLGVGTYRKNIFESHTVHPVVQYTKSDYIFKLTHLPMVQFKWMFVELTKKIINSDHRNAKIIQGQLRITKTVADKTKKEIVPKAIPFSKYKNADTIMQMVQLCNENNIELIILEMPGFKNTRNNEAIGPYELDYSESMKVKLYNFNGPEIDSVIDPNNDWLGGSHLNKKGAEKFTKYLKSYVVQ